MMDRVEADRERRARDEAAKRAETFRDAQPLRLDPVMSLGLPPGVVEIGVAFDDRLVVVSSDADPASTFAGRTGAPNSPIFPHSRADTTYALSVELIADDGARQSCRLTEVVVAHPTVQPCPNGQLLVVGGRSRWVDGAAEHNALLFDADGTLASSFSVGDGVEHVQVTPTGRVWVGYFDEGVMGNYGWGGKRGPEPLGSSGLVCWSLAGERLYQFWPPGGFDRIIDCYAMCVENEEVWACYDSEFPIVRVDAAFETAAWHYGIEGATALAVDAGRVALVGGYSGLFDRVMVVDVRAGELSRRVCQLVMPDGAELPVEARIVARGRFIHAVVDDEWLRFDLGDLADTQ